MFCDFLRFYLVFFIIHMSRNLKYRPSRSFSICYFFKLPPNSIRTPPLFFNFFFPNIHPYFLSFLPFFPPSHPHQKLRLTLEFPFLLPIPPNLPPRPKKFRIFSKNRKKPGSLTRTQILYTVTLSKADKQIQL